MEIDALREKMPRFVIGALREEEMLEVSQALADSPDVMEEMRFALMMRRAFSPDTAALPPFPKLPAGQEQRAPSFIPQSLHNSLDLLQNAARVTRSAVKTAFNFL